MLNDKMFLETEMTYIACIFFKIQILGEFDKLCIAQVKCKYSLNLCDVKLCLGSIGMNHAISELFYKETILQSNYRQMTILWSFAYNSFVKSHGKNKWEPQHGRVLSKSVIMRLCCKGTVHDSDTPSFLCNIGIVSVNILS